MESPKEKKIIYGALSVVSGVLVSLLLDKLRKKETETDNTDKIEIKNRKFSLRKESGTPVGSSLVFNRLKVNNSNNSLLDELKFLDTPTCEITRVDHLAWDLEISEIPDIKSPLVGSGNKRSVFGGEGFLPEETFIFANSFILAKAEFSPVDNLLQIKRWLRGGPRKHLYFNPEETRACIATCGGVTPGLNVVIRELVMSLSYNYKVKTIYGIQHGFKGFYEKDWVNMVPHEIKTIHHYGGSFLGCCRGGFNLEKIINALIEKNINQIYLLGGDGTIRAADELYKEIKKRKLNINLCVIPHAVDNDIPFIDKSIGFCSIIDETQKAIQSAYVESHSAEYGVGIVRLMGKSTGWVAMHAALASRDVNVCLVPEFPFELYGEHGVIEHVIRRLKYKNTCVVVVSEGAGDAMLDDRLDIRGYDASGNRRFADFGYFLKEKINEACVRNNIDASIKYINPMCMVRVGTANASDKKICSQLAQNSVHGMMAGFTFFACGNVFAKSCFIPIKEMIDNYPSKITPTNLNWQKFLANSGQPSFINDELKIFRRKQAIN